MSTRDWRNQTAPMLAAVLMLFWLGACGGSGGAAPPPASSADVKVMLPQALSATDVTRIHVEVRGPGITGPLGVDLTRQGSTWLGKLAGIPVGTDRFFEATAYDATSTVLYQGQVGPMNIVAGRIAAVVIMLQEANPPPPFENEAPLLDSLVASASEVEPGATITLTATAHDNNPGDTLSYTWSAAAGTFSTPNGASTTWTAPATEGVQRIQFEVMDSKGASATISIDITVKVGGASGQASVAVSVNTWPVVSMMAGAPSVLTVDGTTQLAVSASDPDGDVLAYAWSTSCAGTFSDPSARAPAFTLRAAPAVPRCDFTVAVTDGRGGQQTGRLTLHFGGGPQVNLLPPVVDSVAQSTNVAGPAEPVTLGLVAHDPDGTALTFTWQAPEGLLQNLQSTDTSAQAVWTSPTCLTGLVEVTVTVTDASGAATPVTFTINPRPGVSCSNQTVTGRRFAYRMQSDGSYYVEVPFDLSATAIGAWVPTVDGSYTWRPGTGLTDGTFTIENVERTPYLLQLGTRYVWLTSREPDLSEAEAGRADLELEPSGTLFALQLEGLSAWQQDDDLEVTAFGAGITYVSKSQCMSPVFSIPEGDTAVSSTLKYNTSLSNCGNKTGRISLSQGDVAYATQLVARSAPIAGLDSLRELRRGFQVSNGGSGGSLTSSGGTVTLAGTLQALPTTVQSVEVSASEFEAMALAAHPDAQPDEQVLTVGALPAFLSLGTYVGWPDLAVGYIHSPALPLVTAELEYAHPFPEEWDRFISSYASVGVYYSVPLTGGGRSTPAWFAVATYAHEPLPTQGVNRLAPRVSPPRNLRLNEQSATVEREGVSTSPLLAWDPPAVGTPTTYTVRVYRLTVTASNATRRTAVGTFTTTATQLRLPPGFLVSGQHYYVDLEADLNLGGDASLPFLSAPRNYSARAMTSRFQP